jgi:hypothetical protein
MFQLVRAQVFSPMQGLGHVGKMSLRCCCCKRNWADYSLVQTLASGPLQRRDHIVHAHFSSLCRELSQLKDTSWSKPNITSGAGLVTRGREL